MTTKVYYSQNGVRKSYLVTHTEEQEPVEVFKQLGIEYDPDINPTTLPDEDEE